MVVPAAGAPAGDGCPASDRYRLGSSAPSASGIAGLGFALALGFGLGFGFGLPGPQGLLLPHVILSPPLDAQLAVPGSRLAASGTASLASFGINEEQLSCQRVSRPGALWR